MNVEPLNIKVKYHTDIDPLQQIAIGDAIDVRAAEDVDLKVFESKKVSLGFSCKLPDNYLAILSARSSLFDNHGVILTDRKSTRLNSSHRCTSRMPSSA